MRRTLLITGAVLLALNTVLASPKERQRVKYKIRKNIDGDYEKQKVSICNFFSIKSFRLYSLN